MIYHICESKTQNDKSPLSYVMKIQPLYWDHLFISFLAFFLSILYNLYLKDIIYFIQFVVFVRFGHEPQVSSPGKSLPFSTHACCFNAFWQNRFPDAYLTGDVVSLIAEGFLLCRRHISFSLDHAFFQSSLYSFLTALSILTFKV